MRANELIYKARESLGLTQAEIAQQCGVSVHEYADIEQHPDEVTTTVSLATVKRICLVLKLDVLNLIALAGLDLGMPLGTHADVLPRHVLITRHRQSRNLSQSDVANAIGFDDEAIRLGEAADDFLETLPVSVLSDWANYVGLPLGRLVDATE